MIESGSEFLTFGESLSLVKAKIRTENENYRIFLSSGLRLKAKIVS